MWDNNWNNPSGSVDNKLNNGSNTLSEDVSICVDVTSLQSKNLLWDKLSYAVRFGLFLQQPYIRLKAVIDDPIKSIIQSNLFDTDELEKVVQDFQKKIDIYREEQKKIENTESTKQKKKK